MAAESYQLVICEARTAYFEVNYGQSKVKIMPLGGVRENGKNMYIVDVNDIYVLDCGLKYPENELLGIDIVIPDFKAICGE